MINQNVHITSVVIFIVLLLKFIIIIIIIIVIIIIIIITIIVIIIYCPSYMCNKNQKEWKLPFTITPSKQRSIGAKSHHSASWMIITEKLY